MKTKKRGWRRRTVKGLVPVLVLVAFALPIVATFNWLYGAVAGGDQRQTVAVPTFQTREIDRSLAPLKPFDEPLVTVTFDDNWESVYTTALPKLQRYGIRTTQYLIASVFDNPTYMSEAQLLSLQQTGHELAVHTMTHPNLTQLDDKALAWELTESKQILTGKFGPMKDFASPLGAYDGRTIEAIKANFRSHRNTAGGDPSIIEENDVNLRANFSVYDITSYAVRRTTTDDDIRRLLAYAETKNAWMVITYHQVDNEGAYYGVSPEQFERHMAIISASRARSATIGQVLDAMERKLAR